MTHARASGTRQKGATSGSSFCVEAAFEGAMLFEGPRITRSQKPTEKGFGRLLAHYAGGAVRGLSRIASRNRRWRDTPPAE